MDNQIVRYRQNFKVTTVRDVVSIPRKKPLRMYSPELAQDTIKKVAKLIKNTLAVDRNFDKIKCTKLAIEFLAFDTEKSIEEVVVVIKSGSIGRYGKIFGDFTKDLIGDWFMQYNTELSFLMDDVRGHEKEHFSSMLDRVGGELLEGLQKESADRIKQAEEKVQALKNKKAAKKVKKYTSISNYCKANNVDYTDLIDRKDQIWMLMHKAAPMYHFDDFRNIKGNDLLAKMNEGTFKDEPEKDKILINTLTKEIKEAYEDPKQVEMFNSWMELNLPFTILEKEAS